MSVIKIIVITACFLIYISKLLIKTDMKTFVKILVVFSVFTLFSCNKNFDTIPEIIEPITMNDLVIDSEFDWKTTQDIDISFSSSSNYVFYIESLEEDVYQKAFIKSKDVYVSKITLPVYITEVNLRYDGKIIKIPINDGEIIYSL